MFLNIFIALMLILDTLLSLSYKINLGIMK
jgi:hypothetical protein